MQKPDKRSKRRPASSIDSGRIVHDYRGLDEIQMEQVAKSSLGGEDEQLAEKLVDLVHQHRVIEKAYDAAPSEAVKAAADKVREEIREIGNRLCSNGGSDRMKLVAYRVDALGVSKKVSIRYLEFHWEGIGGWMI